MSVADGEAVLLSVPDVWERIVEGEARARLEAALPDMLKRQRWFGGKARSIMATEIVEAIPIQTGAVRAMVLFVAVSYGDGARETYVLPLTSAFGQEAHRIAGEPSQAVLAWVTAGETGPERRGILYDAMGHEEFAQGLLQAMGRGDRFPGKTGSLVASQTAAYRAIVPAERRMPARVLKAEQSNTSVVYGDRAMLKLYRRLQPGGNPDVEIGRFLTSVGFASSPAVGGAVEYLSSAGESMAVAMLQAFVPNEGDAWTWTLEALESYLSRLSVSGTGVDPNVGSGRTYRDPAQTPLPEQVRQLIGPALEAGARLGRLTAALHLALGQSQDDPDFRPEPMTRTYRQARCESMLALWTDAGRLLAERRAALPGDVRQAADVLLSRAEEVVACFQALQDLKEGGLRIRCHGDYHLGQVLRTGSDYVVIDFEGEPARPLSERRIKHSPLYDVAGMLRSFAYAAAAVLAGRSEPRAPEYEPWAALWSRCVGGEFLGAYLAETEGRPIRPQGAEAINLLLTVHLLEKAVYELRYELNNRPEWAPIPIKGIMEILDMAGPKADGPGRKR